jgi:hypothetical protein
VLGDNRTLLVHLITAGRRSAPAEEVIPKGPHSQESLGTAGPAPTFEDLLSTPHDEDLFDYYATSQLSYLDSATGKTTPLGKPAIYTQVRPSPDLKHILVAHRHKPYSYQLPAGPSRRRSRSGTAPRKWNTKSRAFPLPSTFLWTVFALVRALSSGFPKSRLC